MQQQLNEDHEQAQAQARRQLLLYMPDPEQQMFPKLAAILDNADELAAFPASPTCIKALRIAAASFIHCFPSTHNSPLCLIAARTLTTLLRSIFAQHILERETNRSDGFCGIGMFNCTIDCTIDCTAQSSCSLESKKHAPAPASSSQTS